MLANNRKVVPTIISPILYYQSMLSFHIFSSEYIQATHKHRIIFWVLIFMLGPTNLREQQNILLITSLGHAISCL